uniref:U26-Austrotoxin-Ht1t_1 n=1 Tax=Hickmania troglodytes TaxID=489260 RepID=A0A482ZCK5_9ARAC
MMKLLLCLALCAISLSQASITDRKAAYEELSDATSFFKNVVGLPQYQEKKQGKAKCIEKHHECTNDRANCCTSVMFQYKCKCYNIVHDNGTTKERCACKMPMGKQAVEKLLGFALSK